MNKYLVAFENVGRNKLSWTQEINAGELDEQILRAIKLKGALVSRGIDVDWNEDGMGGNILVGGWRVVGTFALNTASRQSR